MARKQKKAAPEPEFTLDDRDTFRFRRAPKQKRIRTMTDLLRLATRYHGNQAYTYNDSGERVLDEWDEDDLMQSNTIFNRGVLNPARNKD